MKASGPKSAQKSAQSATDHPLPISASLLDHHLETLTKSLEHWLERKRVAPVILLTGPEGIGKRAFAYHLAQWLFCERTGMSEQGSSDDSQGGLFGDSLIESPQPVSTIGPGRVCGECNPCQKALRGTWVDFTEIQAEETDSGKDGNLKIEQFRDLKATQGFGAFESKHRVTLIRDADRMTPQAANSLLKILEEPPPGWVFVLTCPDASLLLPTLVSRCQVLRLRPLPEALLYRMLSESGIPSDRARVAAAASQGSWGRALYRASDEAGEIRARVGKFLSNPSTEANPLIEWAAADPASFDSLLTELEFSLAQLLAPEPSLTPDLAKHASDLLKRKGTPALARAFWHERAERVFEIRKFQQAPLNRKLLVQELLLPWI